MQDEHNSHYVTSKIALFSEDNAKVLVTHILPDTPEEGYGLPGGHIDANEQPDDAMKRELQEELGVLLDDFKRNTFFQHASGKMVLGYIGIASGELELKPSNPKAEVGEWKTRQEIELLNIDPGYKKFVIDNWPTDKTSLNGRHFLAVFFFSFMWGTFGVDRFYLGKIWTGILKLITFGGFGIWVIIDLVLIISGSMKDKQGNEMRETARYKSFAAKTVLIFALLLGVVMLITGGALIFAAYEFITSIQSGGTDDLTNLLPPGFAPPEIEPLN